jgi:hypothetical protein
MLIRLKCASRISLSTDECSMSTMLSPDEWVLEPYAVITVLLKIFTKNFLRRIGISRLFCYYYYCYLGNKVLKHAINTVIVVILLRNYIWKFFRSIFLDFCGCSNISNDSSSKPHTHFNNSVTLYNITMKLNRKLLYIVQFISIKVNIDSINTLTKIHLYNCVYFRLVSSSMNFSILIFILIAAKVRLLSLL